MTDAHVQSESPSRQQFTLCFIYQHPRLLLGLKKRGFGVGKWNGFGGKVNAGESIDAAARREVKEEAGIEVGDLQQVGRLEFRFMAFPTIFDVTVFKTEQFTGEPIETEEMKPQWFSVDSLPYEQMWSDDPLWLPWLLEGKKFRGSFLLGTNDEIITHQLDRVTHL